MKYNLVFIMVAVLEKNLSTYEESFFFFFFFFSYSNEKTQLSA